ncbi:MAG TPA: lysoplasmalogenase, partial [Anaerolineales bacterium]|nr:lysoplasmalogenase [Anaerolineales bacterium]
ALEAVAVSKNVQRLEYVAKPAVMICLLLWLYANTGLHGNPIWFGAGLLFSLVGDVLLILALDRLFLFGLIAFLFAHFSYIMGFWEEIITPSAWSLILLMFIATGASRLIWRIVGTMRAKGQGALIVPVVVYGAVISTMLYAAMSTMYSPTWKMNAALFVSLGAFLFWISDLILAWNQFVSPINNGRISNIMTYHLGQIGLIAGVISQFR